MTIQITSPQRDALYAQLLDHLAHIQDLWLVVESKNYQMATRMSQEYCDELRLIVEDLGWGDDLGRGAELTAPPEVLRRVFRRMLDSSLGERESNRAELAEAQAIEGRARIVVEACEAVLAHLDQRSSGAERNELDLSAGEAN